MKVSVIVPGYNVEHYIKECLDSLLNQTLQEIEIICVNDGSKDKTLEIMTEYSKKDQRVVVVDKPNGGLSSARNAGLEKGKGEYILFLDSDDYLASNALEVLYEKAAENDADDVLYSAESFFEKEELKEKYASYTTYYDKKGVYEGVYGGKELYSLQTEQNDFKSSACLQLIRRSLLEQNQIRFYEGILHEDHLFTMQVLTYSEKVCCIEDKLYKRRVRDDSIMTAEKGFRNAYGYFVTIEEMYQMLEKLEEPFSSSYAMAVRKHSESLMKSGAKCLDGIGLEELEEYLKDLSYERRIRFYLIMEHTKKLQDAIDKKNDRIKKQSEKIKKLTEQLEQKKASKSPEKESRWSGLFGKKKD